MSIYNFALSSILLFANWLFITSYINIYKFYSFDKNINIPKKIFIVYIFTFIFLFLVFLFPNIYFQYNSINEFKFIPYFFLMIFIFWLLIIYGIYLYFFEKITLVNILIVVLITLLNISFIYPILLSIAFNKYE